MQLDETWGQRQGATEDDFLTLADIESAGGTSNAAKLGNNYFGVHNVDSGPFPGQTGTYVTSGIDGVQETLLDHWIPPFSSSSPKQAVAAFPAADGFYLSGSVVVQSLSKVSGQFTNAQDFSAAVHSEGWAQGYTLNVYTRTFQRHFQIMQGIEH